MKNTFLLLFLLAGAAWAQDAPRKAVIKSDSSPVAPRFQIVINPEVRADTFLLDTATGKIWRMTKFSGFVGEPSVWEYMDRIDDDHQEAVWVQGHNLKPETK